MLILIGVLLLPGELSVAVERPSGYAEQRFACTAAGVEQLMEFVAVSLGSGEPAIQFVVGPIERQSECTSFFAALSTYGIGNAAVSAAELEAYQSARGELETTAVSVAEVYREKHARTLMPR